MLALWALFLHEEVVYLLLVNFLVYVFKISF